jgi:hypothetical protein
VIYQIAWILRWSIDVTQNWCRVLISDYNKMFWIYGSKP